MSWISGECQGDRNWKCTYSTFDTWEDFCIDSDGPCFSIYDNAGLIGAECIRNCPPGTGGGDGNW